MANNRNPYQIYGLGFVKLSSLKVSIAFYSLILSTGVAEGGCPDSFGVAGRFQPTPLPRI
jgi:hypothetical protein